ncbi:MAG TPA: YbdD/YjiX family protein [Crenalkalicoccus sp.]|jgi:uncharacterized short protein YbdD (DUF466 family)|nr:YbdD/YjiX family protein [Crenalkalicoccus sp.]
MSDTSPYPGRPAAAGKRLSGLLRCLCDGARLMVGVPPYEDYLAHMARCHPGEPVMSYADFIQNRQAARFGGGGGGLRCC